MTPIYYLPHDTPDRATGQALVVAGEELLLPRLGPSDVHMRGAGDERKRLDFLMEPVCAKKSPRRCLGPGGACGTIDRNDARMRESSQGFRMAVPGMVGVWRNRS